MEIIVWRCPREIMSGCTRRLALARPGDAATVHDSSKSDRPRGYGHRHGYTLIFVSVATCPHAIHVTLGKRRLTKQIVQTNIAIPPSTPAARILMSFKNERSARICEVKITPA